jgi:hypothetical protein
MMPDPQFVPYLNKKNIKFVSETTDKTKMVNILHSHHAFVFPSKGEGWGYPPMEALATGMPVILTNAHGHKDFFTSGCYEVGTTFEPAEIAARDFEFTMGNKKVTMKSNQNNELWRNSGDWWKPNFEDIKKQMRHVFENYEACLEEAAKGATEIKAKYSYKVINPRLGQIAGRLASGEYDKTKQEVKTPVKRNYKAFVLTYEGDFAFIHRPIESLKKQGCEVTLVADRLDWKKQVFPLMHKFKIKVKAKKLEDDFAKYRNEIFQDVENGDWVIMVDGDEIISDNLISELDKYLDEHLGIDCVTLARINTYGDMDNPPKPDWGNPTGDQYPDHQRRIFRKSDLTYYEGRVHEQLGGWNAEARLTGEPFTIIHHKSLEKHTKSNNYYELLQSMQRG